MVWEGEDPPAATEDDRLAIQVFNALSNGMGGMDWAGLPVMCEWLGIQDVDGLMLRLTTIKTHRPPKSE